MARKILTNGEFHKILNEFETLVNVGKYKKMPYNTYRQMRKVSSPEIVLDIQKYTDFDGSTKINSLVYDGDMCHSFQINDISFGDFLYNYLMEETKMHPDNEKKLMYDLFGEVKYASKTEMDETAKAALHEYWAEKALNDNCTASSCVVNSDDIGKVITYAGDPVCGWADAATAVTADLSTCHTEIKTGLDVVRERLDEVEANNHKQYNDIAELRHCKADIEHVYQVEESLLDKLDEVAYLTDEQYRMIQDLADRVVEVEKKTAFSTININGPTITSQSTSSNVYPVKNFKLNIAGGAIDDPCSDNRKEKENMDTNKMFAGFEFGPVDDRIKMSPYGMAVRNADGRYVSYDAKSGNIVDVEVFNFGNHNLIFKAPVAVSAIAVGDTIIHMKKPMFVTSIENGITAIDIYNGEIKTIMPATNMFGFNFVTKVVSLFNFTGANAPTAENPFGNILPFILMGNESRDFKEMLPLLLFANGGGNLDMSNPIVMYALMGNDGDMSDVLPFLMWGNMMQTPAAAPVQHQCNCQNHQ